MTDHEFAKAKARMVVDDACTRHQSTRRQFQNMEALFTTDQEARFDTDTFTTALWPLLCARISSIQDTPDLPKPVVHYYASALLEYNVGNGGFAQAAFNCAQWFPLAAEGYDALGFSRSARLLRDAARWLPAEQQKLKEKGLFSAKIGQVFAHFAESRIATFDERIIESEWYVAEARVQYARANRDAFCGIG